MEEKDILKSLNGIDYSQDEIGEYLHLSDMNKDGLSQISGAVKTSLALSELNKINKNVFKVLEKGERLGKIIKIRNIKAINGITGASILGGTLFASFDYGVFNTIYFTNKRLIVIDTNVANSPLKYSFINKKDIIGIEFTTKVVSVVKDEQGEAKVKITKSKLKKVLRVIRLVTFFGAVISFNLDNEPLCGYLVFQYMTSVFITFVKILNDAIINPVKMVIKDGTIYSMVIASDDYKKCYEYLSRMAKEIENKE